MKLSSVEERMVDRREYDSDKILSTLHQCFEEKDDVDRNGLSEEDAANLEEEDEIERDMMPSAEEEDEQMLGGGNVEIEQEEMSESDAVLSTDRGFNVNCITDVWHKGLGLLRTDDIKGKRQSAKDRDVRERKLMDVIGEYIERAQREKRSTRLQPEEKVEDKPDWLEQCSSMSRFG